ncbi:hypothetical protein M622_09360 [Thauera terpenica 58Eu]|uniref:Uncharacterized protein n=1 Tax=Thauera terpenica 58Eu TaxID=1348657 RepID=T0B303_9RHOO|nr:hypothetical protein M622_09360 [Thauera terpenica 58Eu]
MLAWSTISLAMCLTSQVGLLVLRSKGLAYLLSGTRTSRAID